MRVTVLMCVGIHSTEFTFSVNDHFKPRPSDSLAPYHFPAY